MFDTQKLAGSLLFVSGPEKNCGKTTTMLALAADLRRDQPERPLALLTVGYDGEARDLLSGARKPAVTVAAGDYFVTTERFLRAAGLCAEIVDTVPGATALGRCCIARAGRPGLVALVGPEGNSAVALALERLRELAPDATILVDGAINRITQLSGINGAKLIYALRIDQTGLDRNLDRLRRLSLLLQLPSVATLEAQTPCVHVPGALTRESLARLVAAGSVSQISALAVDDFTKVFLDLAELRALLRERGLFVRAAVSCAAVVTIARGLNDRRIRELLADSYLESLLVTNPYRQETQAR